MTTTHKPEAFGKRGMRDAGPRLLPPITEQKMTDTTANTISVSGVIPITVRRTSAPRKRASPKAAFSARSVRPRSEAWFPQNLDSQAWVHPVSAGLVAQAEYDAWQEHEKALRRSYDLDIPVSGAADFRAIHVAALFQLLRSGAMPHSNGLDPLPLVVGMARFAVGQSTRRQDFAGPTKSLLEP